MPPRAAFVPEPPPEVPAPPPAPPVPEPVHAAGPPSDELTSATLAELYFKQGFTEKAVEVYRQLLEREPENDRLRRRLAELQEAPSAPVAPAEERRLRPGAGAGTDGGSGAGDGHGRGRGFAPACPGAYDRQARRHAVRHQEGMNA